MMLGKSAIQRRMWGYLVGSIIGVVGAGASWQVEAQQWAMASAYPETNFHTQNIKQFIDDVKAATGGKLVITLHPNQSLVPMPQIKRAIQSGQIQLGEILLSAYGNEDPFFEVDGVPMLSPGYDNAKKLWSATRPYIEKRFRAQGLIPLFSVVWPSQGIYTKKPIASLNDLKGVKFRSYNPATARMAELIGAVPTTVQQAELAQAFATGIVDSMVTSAFTGVETKAWDFVNYYYDVRVINNKNVVLVSEKAFSGLDPATRDAVMRAASVAETRGWAASEKAMNEMTARLAAGGVKVVPPTPALQAELAAIGDRMVADWVKKAGTDGDLLLKTYRGK